MQPDSGVPPFARLAVTRSFILHATCAAAFAITGCSFDLVEAGGDPTTSHADLRVDVPACAAPLTVEATFVPGTDAEGRIHPAARDTFWLGPHALTPSAVHEQGVRIYEAHDLDASIVAPLNGIHVRAPDIDQTALPAPVLDVHILRPLLRDTLVADPAGDIVVDLVGMSAPHLGVAGPHLQTGSAAATWSVAIRQDSVPAYVLSLDGRAPRDRLVIASTLLPSDFRTGTLHVSGDAYHIMTATGRTYRLIVRRSFNCTVPFRLAH